MPSRSSGLPRKLLLKAKKCEESRSLRLRDSSQRTAGEGSGGGNVFAEGLRLCVRGCLRAGHATECHAVGDGVAA